VLSMPERVEGGGVGDGGGGGGEMKNEVQFVPLLQGFHGIE
jgi:hypothetical protein